MNKKMYASKIFFISLVISLILVNVTFADWVQSQKMLETNGEQSNNFGAGVSLSGNYALVGNFGNHQNVGNNNFGNAYIFYNDGSSWVEQDSLTHDDEYAEFGSVLANTDNYAAVSATSYQATTNTGVIFMYGRSGTDWSQLQILSASDGVSSTAVFGLSFGSSVALDDTYVISGFPDKNADQDTQVEQGAAYIYTRSGSTWGSEVEIVPSDPADLKDFGLSVAINNTYAIVGSGDDGNGANAGAVYVFTRSGSDWNQTQKLISSDITAGDIFGSSVSLDGDYLIVGAPYQNGGFPTAKGAAYIFHQSGGTWTQQAKIVASDGINGDVFGVKVGISGTQAIVATNQSSSTTGAAYVFVRSGTTWSQENKLVADDAATYDQFGRSVAISGTFSLVGSQTNDNGNGADAGAAYFFEFFPPAGIPEFSTIAYGTALVCCLWFVVTQRRYGLT